MTNSDHQQRTDRALAGNMRINAGRETDKLARQHKLFVRDRIALLVDPGSFVEDGLLANTLAADLPADGVVTGVGDARGEAVQLDRTEADDPGERLAMGKAGVGEERVGGASGDFDVIAKDVVVADLQSRDAGFAAQPGFERRDQPPAVVGSGA